MDMVDRVESTVCRPAFLLAVGVLVVNDHFLKGIGLLPGWLTGKLSDVAGLFFFPVLLVVLLARVSRLQDISEVRRLFGAVAAVVAVAFSALNLVPSLAGRFSRVWGVWTPDATDLVCLPSVVLAGFWLDRRVRREMPGFEPSRLARFALVVLASAASLATSPPPAETPESSLQNRRDASLGFVDSSTRLLVETEREGFLRVSLDGTERLDLASERFRLRAIASESSRLIWTDNRGRYFGQTLGEEPRRLLASSDYNYESMTRTGWAVVFSKGRNIYLCDGCEQPPTKVAQFDRSVGQAKISPDGEWVAVSLRALHPDPVWWKVEYGVVEQRPAKLLLVDVATGKTKTIADDAGAMHAMAWSIDAEQLYFNPYGPKRRGYAVENGRWENLSESEISPDDLFPPSNRRPGTCSRGAGRLGLQRAGGRQGLEGLEIVREDGSTEQIVDLEITGAIEEDGRYRSPIGEHFFADGCDYVVFEFDRAFWVVDVETHIVGRLVVGSTAWVLDNE
jgi:hypothetical protein